MLRGLAQNGAEIKPSPSGILTKAKDEEEEEENVGEDFDLRGVQGVPDVAR